MPTYDYKCTVCEHVQEIFHSINEDPEFVCEKCGKPTKRLVGGGTGHIMKSGGTRNQTWKARHGHKKDSAATTPQEAADIKAKEIISESKYAEAKKSDPYAEHRT